MAELQRFRSNGKLLITGEYLVLRGATALAVPLQLGQSLSISQNHTGGPGKLIWNAFTPKNNWFKAVFALPELNILETDDMPKAAKLQSILLTLRQLKKGLFNWNTDYRVDTRLEFQPEWGLGSSSTLIVNLAQWAGVDPYTLLNFSIGGSGYDIACAMTENPIFYTLEKLRPRAQQVNFKPKFADYLYFVYLGQKQDSEMGIQYFNKYVGDKNLTSVSKLISKISHEMAVTDSFERFCELSEEHESIISGIILTPALATQFPDFKGKIKSLGAWGGDFAMVMYEGEKSDLLRYFAGQGLHTLFTFNELVIDQANAQARSNN